VLRVCPACQATFRGEERYCIRDAHELIPATDEQADAALVGATIGNYRLTEVVGRGGMGTVYAAEHIYLGKRVAMKILHERWARNGDAVGRFLREARAASSINHPNIVDVFDFGPAPDGRVYLAMELLAGQDLDNQLDRQGPIPLHRAIHVVHQIASALAAAHEKGIVHSDLKPANVRLLPRAGRREVIRSQGAAEGGAPRFTIEPEGPWDFVKVLDFGIARVHSLEPGDDPPEGVPHIYGTPEYMAPETAQGDEVDARADIYALGILFFEMLTGATPFHAASPLGILHKHIAEPPPVPSRFAPEAEITPAADRLILRALSKEPGERQQSMDELRAELAGCHGSVAFRRDSQRIAGASDGAAGPRRRRLTDELDAWLRAEREKMERARRASEAEPAAAAEPTEPDAPEEPLLLTQRKPIA
jgi:serine/threonine-protein kinase